VALLEVEDHYDVYHVLNTGHTNRVF